MSDHEYITKLSVALANLLAVSNVAFGYNDNVWQQSERLSGIYHAREVAQAALDQPR
jgi:hypothetical protein